MKDNVQGRWLFYIVFSILDVNGGLAFPTMIWSDKMSSYSTMCTFSFKLLWHAMLLEVYGSKWSSDFFDLSLYVLCYILYAVNLNYLYVYLLILISPFVRSYRWRNLSTLAFWFILVKRDLRELPWASMLHFLLIQILTCQPSLFPLHKFMIGFCKIWPPAWNIFPRELLPKKMDHLFRLIRMFPWLMPAQVQQRLQPVPEDPVLLRGSLNHLMWNMHLSLKALP